MPQANIATNIEQPTEFINLYQSLTSARATYEELLQRLSAVGHKIEDTNLPQAESGVKNMKETPRPGILHDISNETDLIHKKNDWLREIVIKLERLF